MAGDQSSLVSHVFRLLRKNPVEWVLLENVPFMLQLSRGSAMRYVVGELEKLGYRWAYRVLDTRAFGIPQRRQRVFLLASLSADPAELLFSDDAGLPDEADFAGQACGFYWTEGTRGLGWAVNAIPTLKGGSGLGMSFAAGDLVPRWTDRHSVNRGRRAPTRVRGGLDQAGNKNCSADGPLETGRQCRDRRLCGVGRTKNHERAARSARSA